MEISIEGRGQSTGAIGGGTQSGQQESPSSWGTTIGRIYEQGWSLGGVTGMIVISGASAASNVSGFSVSQVSFGLRGYSTVVARSLATEAVEVTTLQPRVESHLLGDAEIQEIASGKVFDDAMSREGLSPGESSKIITRLQGMAEDDGLRISAEQAKALGGLMVFILQRLEEEGA
jgi:hypothetical protein